MNARCLTSDSREHDLGRGHGEVVAVVLAHAKEVNAMLIGEDGLGDHVTNHLGLRFGSAVAALCDVTVAVESELKGVVHVAHFVAGGGAACARSAPVAAVASLAGVGRRRAIRAEAIATAAHTSTATR